jgi:hypothetical protein
MLEILGLIDKQAKVLEVRPDVGATSLVIVESDVPPDAKQRQRLGEAAKKVRRGAQVLVTRSTLVRMVMTAIRWFSPANAAYAQATFATYEEARAWLVQHTSFPADVIDAMHKQARAKLAAPASSVRAR